jgi:gluconolactonase
MSEDLSRLSVLVWGLDHPEGVCTAPDGHLYATGEAGQVYRVDLATKSFAQIGSTGGFGLGIAADAHSNLYICDMGVKAVVRVRQDGTSSLYSRGAAGEELTVPNFPVFDAAGNLYVSNSGGWGAKNGTIQRIASDASSSTSWNRPRRSSRASPSPPAAPPAPTKSSPNCH